MKKLIALFLALAAALVLLASCEPKQITIGPDAPETAAPIPPRLDEDAVKEALTKIGADDLTNLNENQQKALQSELNKEGYGVTVESGKLQVTLPPGVTEPVTTKPAPPPTTMPKGTQVQSSEVYPYIKNIVDIMNSKKFYLKGRGGVPMDQSAGVPAAASNAPMVFAVDGKKSMMEFDADWTAMARDDSGKNDYGSAKAIGLIMQNTFGKKARLIMTGDTFYFVYPEKKKYMDPTSFKELAKAFGADESALGDMDMSMGGLDVAGQVFGEAIEVPKDVKSSKVQSGGKEYLVATLESDGSTARYYFLDGKLKRIEMEVKGVDENSILEIDEFNGEPDPALFSVAGMRKMPLSEMMAFGTAMMKFAS